MTEDTGPIGTPHDTQPDDFIGSDPAADVGEPNALNEPIGIPAPPDDGG
jgi:hypothetical protein